MGLSALKNKAPVNCATTLPLEDGGRILCNGLIGEGMQCRTIQVNKNLLPRFNKWNKMVVNAPFSMLMLGKGTAEAEITCQVVYHVTHPPFLCALP